MIFHAPFDKAPLKHIPTRDAQGHRPLIQKSHMIEGILKFLILTINECAKRITVLSFFVLFIFMQIFGRTLAKVEIPEFDT
jgi:hypothetical protein